jgi:hypothetical protein
MNFNTLYNRNFNKNKKQKYNIRSSTNLKEAARKLRASNIVLGTDKENKLSEFQRKFDSKKSSLKRQNGKSKVESNVPLGGKSGDFLTTF